MRTSNRPPGEQPHVEITGAILTQSIYTWFYVLVGFKQQICVKTNCQKNYSKNTAEFCYCLFMENA